MKNTKRALCLLMAFCLLLGSFTVGAAAADEISFSDVAKDAWYYSPIIKAVEKGIVLGNADGTYAPNGTLTWAQTITFAVRLDQLRKGEKVYGSEDAAGENWYDIYVDYALDNGIINSVPVTPNGTITRADAAIIFSKVLGEYTAVNTVPEDYFTDVRSAHPARKAIYILTEAGICIGKGNRLFGINDSFLRSEVAAIVARMAGLVDKVYIQSEEESNFYAPLEGRIFRYTQTFSGGTTTLTMGEAGSFSGQYMLFKPGETGDDYPKGTIYLSNFTGRFTNAVEKSSRLYTLDISSLSLSTAAGNTVYKDGYRYIATEAHGFENASSVELYMSGASTAAMDECLLNALVVAKKWVGSVPTGTAGALIYNSASHKVFVEDVSASVSAAKLFSTLEGMSFTYSSGAGAWSTTITFGANGSFEGQHTDTNMGETGDAYPKGTVYTSSFYGSFADPTWENDYQYSLRLKNLYLRDNALGSATVKDGVRYVTTGAVGFEKAGYFTLYLPGMNPSKTPEPMQSWLAALEGWGSSRPAGLSSWTLYNVGGQAPFVSGN